MSTLFDAFEDFILSREAELCSPQTIDFYRRMLNPFLAFAADWPLSNRVVREFLATVVQWGVSAATVHAHARAVRAFVRFAYQEGWIEERVRVPIPRLAQMRMAELCPSSDLRRAGSVTACERSGNHPHRHTLGHVRQRETASKIHLPLSSFARPPED